MFDIGFSELFVIAIVALLVLGPERLPRAARFTGLWVRRARAQWYSVKSELENELADEELKRSLRAAQDDLREAREQLRDGGQSLREFAQRDPDRPPPEPREPDPAGPQRRDPEPGEPTRRDPDPSGPAKREPDPRSPEQPEPPQKRLDADAAAPADGANAAPGHRDR